MKMQLVQGAIVRMGACISLLLLLLTKGSFHFLLPGVADERNVSKDNREKEREGEEGKGQMGG